ncbi:MAG: hypothetical protein V4731_08245 [Pseudomonadota bacterium]
MPQDQCEAPASRQPVHAPLAFHTLLYRYLFFAWLFRDVNHGTIFERAAAWRHNKAQAHWLPTYMRRWLGCAVFLYGTGSLVELGMGLPALSAFFYVPGVLSVTINTVIGVAWVGLKVLESPLG